MRYAVVGAGVAGLVAAHRLQAAGHQVVVLESAQAVGGRTRTVALPHENLLDTGAAWLADFYPVALQHAQGLPMLNRDVTGTPRLRIDGDGEVPAPFSPMHLATSELLPLRERIRMARWSAQALVRGTHVGPRAGLRQPGDLVDAVTEARTKVGPNVVDYVLRPVFETMVFSPLEELSAAFVSGWLAGAATARFSVPAAGMDAPWRRLADHLDVRTGVRVTRVRAQRDDVQVGAADDSMPFDGVVVAVPAPVAAAIVDAGTPGLPSWLPSVRYSTHVFGYGARQHAAAPPTSDIHPAGPGPHPVGSVQLLRGGDGRVPDGWQGAVVSASGPWSGELLDAPDDEVLESLWQHGAVLEPALFDLADCEVSYVARWRYAVPVFGPGHLTRLSAWQPQPPVALAGDWSVYPCIEGAAVSGLRAAEALL